MSGEVTKLLALPDDPAAAPAAPLQVAGGIPASAGAVTAAAFDGGTGATGMLPVVSHDVHLVAKGGTPIWKKAALAGAVVFSLVGVYFVMNPEALNEMLVMLGLGTEEIVVAHPPKKKMPVAVAPPAASPAPKEDKSGSIWNSIDNDYGAALPEVAAPLTADQEAKFQSGLDSQFTYQRYKTVLDLTNTRARGSEDMLREALESNKFWTRMRAIIGLAEMGEEISDEDMKKALGDAHSELRARFFKRFAKSPCGPGCFYVARAALPHLDALGREEVIRVVSREDSEIRDVFMVAATFDEAESVRRAAAEWLDGHSVKPEIWKDIKELSGH